MKRSASGFHAAWDTLHPAYQRCLQLAYQSLRRGGLASGAAVTDRAGTIIGEGRNRAHDPPGGEGALQATGLAHAELNALAAIPTARDLGPCTLWSTQRPCMMCGAAVEFLGVGRIRFLADDPTFVGLEGGATGALGQPAEEPTQDWVVVANVLFLHTIIQAQGLRTAIVLRNLELEPETAALASELVEDSLLIDHFRGVPLGDVLTALWDRVTEAAARRAIRLDRG